MSETIHYWTKPVSGDYCSPCGANGDLDKVTTVRKKVTCKECLAKMEVPA